MATDKELCNYYNIIERLVLDAGKVIAGAIDKDKNATSKGIDWDLVTEYDRRIEETLMKSLLQTFPSHKFIGEESVAKEGKLPKLGDEPTWIIDPIDGTSNFVHNFPHSCISVALAVKKKLEIGIIYNPLMGQFFSARRGFGAFLNGKPIRTSKVQDLSEALIGLEPWIAKDPNYTKSIYNRTHLLIQNTHGIRCLGSAALSLCYVAMGALEAYHVEDIDIWDVAAGKLIIEEAGGVVVDTNGSELDLVVPRTVAACSIGMANQLVDLFKKSESGSVDQ